ncbi:MAG: Amuc_1098 family type IV pilus outer membrane protein, partial [Verrucomicrobiales bacterium]
MPLVTSAQTSTSELARAELNRRAAAVHESKGIIAQGDEAYEAGRYADASEFYRQALDLMPAGAPAIAAQRQAVVQRYVQASVEVAKERRRFGDLEGAHAAVDRVLVDEIAPGAHEALAMREQLNDPIRTNPASSLEHSRDVEEVRLLLFKAEGAFQLGKFDQALEVYQDVLRVDPTNSAARRGMEKVAASKSLYYQAAYDHTRAEMLSMVDAGWELSLTPEGDLGTAGDYRSVENRDSYLNKLHDIVVPVVALDDVNLVEAVDFIRAQSIELDQSELDPLLRGINLVIDVGGADSEIGNQIRSKRFSINLRNVPLKELIRYVADSTSTVVVEQPVAVVFRPVGSDSSDMVVKTYRVPPDFLTAGASTDVSVGGNEIDPFAEPSEGSALPRRLTAEEVLKQRGVSFPEGASASFSAASSTLRVRNTMTAHSLVDQIVDTLASEEPTSIIVDVKMIKTTETRLEELGFDWLLGDFGLTENTYLTGGTQGNGGDLGDISVPSAFSTSANPITSGNRSGTEAIPLSSIDDLLQQGGRITSTSTSRAPGALWVNGQFNNTHVTMLMRGLDQKSGVDLAAVPSVTTRSGQAASVRVTREFIYPTDYEPPEIPNSIGGNSVIDLDTGEIQDAGTLSSVPVTPSTPTDFEMREVGIVLDVLP